MLSVRHGGFVARHQFALSLAGIILTFGVIIPACNEFTIPAQRELSITKTGVVTGQVVTYTITVANVGSTPSFGSVVVSDTLGAAPAGTVFTGAAGAVCSAAGSTTLTCTAPPIAMGGSEVLTLAVAVPAGESGDISNCAWIPSDSVSSNNKSCVGNNVAAVPGTITIVEDALPNDSQDFQFTSNRSNIAAFSLDDDSDPTLSNQKVFTGLAAGTYTFTQAPPPVDAWVLTGLVCTANTGGTTSVATATATIILVAGANITCTFTNGE